jgi:hypothetical protein
LVPALTHQPHLLRPPPWPLLSVHASARWSSAGVGRWVDSLPASHGRSHPADRIVRSASHLYADDAQNCGFYRMLFDVPSSVRRRLTGYDINHIIFAAVPTICLFVV